MIETHHYQPVDERTDEDNANVLSLTRSQLRALVIERIRKRDASRTT